MTFMVSEKKLETRTESAGHHKLPVSASLSVGFILNQEGLPSIHGADSRI